MELAPLPQNDPLPHASGDTGSQPPFFTQSAARVWPSERISGEPPQSFTTRS